MKLPFKLFQRNTKPDIETDDILIVNELRKTYGSLVAVNNISFTVRTGSLFAFLGQNGAGKSTTINIICNILNKDSGKIFVSGYDSDRHVQAIKSQVGIVFQNSVLDTLLSPKENLTIRAAFYGIRGNKLKERLKSLADMLDLHSFFDRPVGKLSGGQKRRVDIARAMIHSPKLLVLDEPTTGLDPQTRISVWNLVNNLREKTGMTVFLTTHYMEEAEKSTYVVIMDKGNIIARGTPTELKNAYSGDYVIVYAKRDEKIDQLLTSEQRKYTYNRDSKSYKVIVKDAADAIDFINGHKTYLTDFEVQKGNMDDVFLNITGLKVKTDEENK